MKHILKNKSAVNADTWIFGKWINEEKESFSYCFAHGADNAYVSAVIKKFSGEYGEITSITLPSNADARVFCIGLGEKKSGTTRKLRTAARKIFLQAKSQKTKHIAVCLDDFACKDVSSARIAELLAVNFEMANYSFTRYKETSKDEWKHIESVFYYFRHSAAQKNIQKALSDGAIIGTHVNRTRDLANTPGGDMTPKRLAHSASMDGKKYGYDVTVLGEKEMKKIGMGGILGVSRGSDEEAQFIIMKYMRGPKNQKPIAFIGKGITFDSGGLHLKIGKGMNEMHLDMSGGATVIGAMGAIAQLALRVNVIGIVPAVENMPSGQSYRPGDILTSLSGKTIEVESPDAEGRVVLADALTYVEKYHPSVVVDIATLTGACVIALGKHAIGLLTPHDTYAEFLSKMGEESGDYVWRLPLWEEYESEVKGIFGDVVNAPKNGEAGAINGGMFLYQFAKKFPTWAHLDIASTMTGGEGLYLAKGASGTATRLLIDIARNNIKSHEHNL
jgi:leucyl aminopeptidase